MAGNMKIFNDAGQDGDKHPGQATSSDFASKPVSGNKNTGFDPYKYSSVSSIKSSTPSVGPTIDNAKNLSSSKTAPSSQSTTNSAPATPKTTPMARAYAAKQTASAKTSIANEAAKAQKSANDIKPSYTDSSAMRAYAAADKARDDLEKEKATAYANLEAKKSSMDTKAYEAEKKELDARVAARTKTVEKYAQQQEKAAKSISGGQTREELAEKQEAYDHAKATADSITAQKEEEYNNTKIPASTVDQNKPLTTDATKFASDIDARSKEIQEQNPYQPAIDKEGFKELVNDKEAIKGTELEAKFVAESEARDKEIADIDKQLKNKELPLDQVEELKARKAELENPDYVVDKMYDEGLKADKEAYEAQLAKDSFEQAKADMAQNADILPTTDDINPATGQNYTQEEIDAMAEDVFAAKDQEELMAKAQEVERIKSNQKMMKDLRAEANKYQNGEFDAYQIHRHSVRTLKDSIANGNAQTDESLKDQLNELWDGAINHTDDLIAPFVHLDSRNYDLYSIRLTQPKDIQFLNRQNQPEDLDQWAPIPPYMGDMPYSNSQMRSVKFLPCNGFNYNAWQAQYDDIQLSNNASIYYPRGYNDVRELSITIINDNYDTVNNWLSLYRQIVFPSNNTIRPYKNCCTLCTIYTYDRLDKAPFMYKLLVLPDFTSKMVSNSGGNTVDVNFKVMGLIL